MKNITNKIRDNIKSQTYTLVYKSEWYMTSYGMMSEYVRMRVYDSIEEDLELRVFWNITANIEIDIRLPI